MPAGQPRGRSTSISGRPAREPERAYLAIRQPPGGPEPSDRISRVIGPAQDREHILDMSSFEKLEPAVFNERDIAPLQLDLG